MGTPTANKGYIVPTLNSDFNTWGSEVNANFGAQDLNLGGSQTISVAGNANVTASSSQAQYLITYLTGALTGAIEYILPSVGSFYIIANQTTGAYALTVACAGGGSTVAVPQGTSMILACDGTNIISATNAYLLQSTLPAGVNYGDIKDSGIAVEAGGWRQCYGQTRPRTDPLWVYLTANSISWPWGSGDGSTTYTMPDFRGRSRFSQDNLGGTAANRITSAVSGIAGTNLGATGGDQRAQQDTISVSVSAPSASASATSTVTEPNGGSGHSHLQGSLATSGVGGATAQVAGGGVVANSNASTTLSPTGISVATTVSVSVSAPSASASSSLTGASQNMPPAAIVSTLMYVGA